MNKHVYLKKKRFHTRRFVRLFALLVTLVGLGTTLYTFLPLLSWQLYFAPVFASSDVALPIPKTTLVSSINIESLLQTAASPLTGVDFSNAVNWFPSAKVSGNNASSKTPFYSLSIPSLKIVKAQVSTIDMDLASHLVNYAGTAVPPDKGNAVVFGHSTLPQLFDPTNYKTILANAYQLKVGDEIDAAIGSVTYMYKIISITIVNPTDTSVFTQSYDNSYLTLVTCTPPGTTWKRLIIRSQLQKI